MTTIAPQERVPIGYSLEYIFSFTGRGATKPEVIGLLQGGLRVNFYNSGREINGPWIRGKLRAVGGDRVTVRKDGVALLDARVTLRLMTARSFWQHIPVQSTLARAATRSFSALICRPRLKCGFRRASIRATEAICG